MWKNLLWRAHKENSTEKVAISDCASSLACCSACSWPKVMYKQVAIGKVMSAVPYMSGFLFRFAVFFFITTGPMVATFYLSGTAHFQSLCQWCTSTDKFGSAIDWKQLPPYYGRTAIVWRTSIVWQLTTTDLGHFQLRSNSISGLVCLSVSLSICLSQICPKFLSQISTQSRQFCTHITRTFNLK